MARKTTPATGPSNSTPKPADAKPVTSKLAELAARYAQSVRGKAAAEASSASKPKKASKKKAK